eukprot:3154300-Prymnesium_polylepis.1
MHTDSAEPALSRARTVPTRTVAPRATTHEARDTRLESSVEHGTREHIEREARARLLAWVAISAQRTPAMADAVSIRAPPHPLSTHDSGVWWGGA